MKSEISCSRLRELSVLIGLKAAARLRNMFSADSSIYTKVEREETIKADILSEEYIINQLKSLGFRGKIVTEESDVVELGDEDVIAIIDPLDGSVNYSIGIPWFSVSIAFALRRHNRDATLKDVIAGAVVPILTPTPISFCRGKGIYYGDYLYDFSQSRSFSEGLIVAFYGEDPKALEIYEEIHRHLVKRYGKVRVRSLGSVALDISYLSLKKFDIFVDARARLRNVDIAAGVGLLNEIGGSFVDIEGREIEVSVEKVSPVTSIIASWSADYLNEILRILNGDN